MTSSEELAFLRAERSFLESVLESPPGVIGMFERRSYERRLAAVVEELAALEAAPEEAE